MARQGPPALPRLPRQRAVAPQAAHSLVMELVDLLHVPEDDELLVHDAGRDLLHSARHLPQVGLAGGSRDYTKTDTKLSRNRYF